MRSVKSLKPQKGVGNSGSKPSASGILKPIMKNSRNENSGHHNFDYDLFNSLLTEGKCIDDQEYESSKQGVKRDAGTIRARPINPERLRQLEEELENERQKNEILQQENELLQEQVESNKAEYKQKLEIFSNQIKSYNALQKDLLRSQEEQKTLEKDIRETLIELDQFKMIAKAALEFVIKAFEIVTLLPEQVEVDSVSRSMMEFSFEEKKGELMPKNVFLENKIVKFLEANEKFLSHFKLEGLLLKIIDEYENKKNAADIQRSPRLSPSSSKKNKAREQKTSPKRRSSKLKKLADSFSGMDQSSFDRSEEVHTEKGLQSSHSKSFQNSSGGKSNNYSININLVVNDNSESGTSEQNTSIPIPVQAQTQDMFKLFEKELGCDKDRSDSSIIFNDSLIYSPSDNSIKLSESQQATSKPSKTCQHKDKNEIVVALFEYAKEKSGDLALTAGDKIKVLSKDPSGWWFGRNLTSCQEGYFPSNFVRIL